MSLFKIFDIAGSAMNAHSVRMNTTASNLANINSVHGDPEQLYRARQPVFSTMYDSLRPDPSAIGVRVLGIVEKQGEPTRNYDPGNPLANEQGYVYSPDINAVEEMSNMIAASRAFQHNVEAIDAAKRMILATLQLGE